MGKLTDKVVRQAKPKSYQTEISDEQNGLVLVVYPSGKKSFAVRYRAGPKQRKKSLGPVDRITLGQARKEARALLSLVDEGDDPSSRATTDKSTDPTISEAIDRFETEYRGRKGDKPRKSTMGEYMRQLRADIEPALGDRPIRQVTTGDLAEIVQKSLNRGRQTGIYANRLHATVSLFFGWAARTTPPLIDANPYAGQKKPAAERQRQRVLSWDELATLWNKTGSVDQPFGPLLRILILTGQRVGEVAGMKDSELDLPAALWSLASDRTKNGRSHVVPLAPAALETLGNIKRLRKSKYLFTVNGTKPYGAYETAHKRLRNKLEFAEHWTLHDIRRTFVSGCARIGIAPHVIEETVNHVSGAKAGVAGVYNHYAYEDERREALEAWARFVVDVVANDTARAAYIALRKKGPVHSALVGDERAWQSCAAALQGGSKAWAEYLAALDAPAETAEAA